MNYIITLLCFYISVVNATKYYGFTPTENQHNTIEKSIAEFIGEDREIVSLLGTHDLVSQDVFDFLASADIYNKTLEDIFTTSIDDIDVERRAEVDKVKCYKNVKVTDRLGKKNTKHVCNALSTVLASSYASVAAVVHQKKCNEASTGHPTACTALVAFAGTAGTVLIPAEFPEVCPYFLNIFDDDCDSTEGEITSRAQNVRVIKTVTQKGVSCSDFDDIDGPCTEING